MTKKLILDLDAGIDDAMALAYALASPEVELIGITTVFGNVPCAQSMTNCRALLELLGAPDVPVVAGADRALAATEPYTTMVDVHGANGLGGVELRENRPCIGVVRVLEVSDAAGDRVGERIDVLAVLELLSRRGSLYRLEDVAAAGAHLVDDAAVAGLYGVDDLLTRKPERVLDVRQRGLDLLAGTVERRRYSVYRSPVPLDSLHEEFSSRVAAEFGGDCTSTSAETSTEAVSVPPENGSEYGEIDETPQTVLTIAEPASEHTRHRRIGVPTVAVRVEDISSVHDLVVLMVAVDIDRMQSYPRTFGITWWQCLLYASSMPCFYPPHLAFSVL